MGNSYAESLKTGYLEVKDTYVSIIDADIAVPVNFFRERKAPTLLDGAKTWQT